MSKLGRVLTGVGLALLIAAGAAYGVGVWVQRDARARWEAGESAARVERAAEANAMSASVGAAGAAGAAKGIDVGTPVARLVMPTLGEDDIVLEGVDAYELNGGPGHLPGSPMPGEMGNAVIAAHRDRHFRHLDRLQVGDTVLTYVNGEESVWRVTARRVVAAAAPALFTTTDATLTLTTCWPVRDLGPAPDRLIVSATRIETRRTAT